MVQFGVSTVEEAMKLGKEAAEYISGTFIKVSLCPHLSSILQVQSQFFEFSSRQKLLLSRLSTATRLANI